MLKSKIISMFLVVTFICSMLYAPVQIAYGEEVGFAPVYENFDYPDGTTQITGWKISNNRGAPGDIMQVEDGRLRIVTSAEIGTVVIEGKLPVKFTGNRAIFQFTTEIVKNTGLGNMFPGLGTSGGSGTTQVQVNASGGMTSLTHDNKNKSFSMKLEEGFTYDFGLIIDLENQTQDIYVKNIDTGTIESVTSGFRTKDHSDIEYMKFWLDTWDGGTTGEYYFDNFRFEEANADAMLVFYQKFIAPSDPEEPGEPREPSDVKIDDLSDIKGKIGDAIVVSAGSAYAFANGNRMQIDTTNDAIVAVKENNDVLVPAGFIANSLGVDMSWDSNTITLQQGDTVVGFSVNSNVYTVNENVYGSNAAPQILSGNPFIPLTAAANAFQKEIYRDGKDLFGISDQEIFLDPIEDGAIYQKLVRTFGIYVSPHGNDGNPGTLEQPFQTVQKARDFLRSMKAGDGLPEGGMTVYMGAGEYRFHESLVLEKDDSGSVTSPITYRSVPGEEVLFTGAFNIPVDQFVPVTDVSIKERLYDSVKDKVLQVDLKALGLNNYGSIQRANVFLRESADSVGLILDNVPQTLARWPNEGYVKTGDIVKGSTTTTVGYTEKAPERWGQAEDPWALGFWQYEWRDDTLPIQDVDTANKTFIMENTGDGYKKGQHYYVFNLLEEIDQPGEWYLNRTTGILYYYPPKELNNNKLQLSLFDKQMIAMTNTANIHIKGITFEASTHTGITMNYAKNNLVTNCTFRNLGTQAINIRNASNTGVTDSDIYDIGRGGIYVRGGDRPTLTYGNNYVDNNYITRFSRSVKTYTPAVLLDGVGNRITHNVIHDGPHEGIGVNGNDQFIEYNELYDLCKETGDSGAIYAGRDWTQQGITIRNNILHSMHGNKEMDLHYVFGIYFDDALSGGVVESNLFFDLDTPVNIHGGRSFTIDSNIVANATQSMRLVKYAISQTTELEARYAAMPVKSDLWKNKYPNIDTILEDEPRMPKYNIVRNTLTYNSGGMEIQPEVIQYGTIENNASTMEDPGFVDAANKIFKLGSSFDPSTYGFEDFKPMDYDQVGMKLTQNRTSLPRLSDFQLSSPQNGEQNIEASGFTMTWIPSLGATKYQVLVATDENFQHIVFEGETKNNSIFVSDLEYDTTTYYWTVKAVAGSILYPETKHAVNGVQMFTTAESQAIDYTELLGTIDKAIAFAETTVAGTEAGQYPPAKKEALFIQIDVAELILNDTTATQADIQDAVAALQDAIATLRGSVIAGTADLGTLIRRSTKWLAGDQSFLVFEDDKLTFTPEAGKLMVASYDEKVPKYMTWKLQAAFDFGPGDKWQGFGLRASEPQKVGWSSYASYIIIVKQNQIEVQNFHDGSNRFVIPAIPNDGIIEAGKVYDIEVGAVDVVDGVRLFLTVDGETVFDVVDIGEGSNRYIDDPGYFVIYSSQGYTFRLAAVGETEEQVITSIEPVN